MRKLTTKLLISVLSVTLALAALGTTTFAWFSMNNKVTVTGMEVTTKVQNNLLIAEASGTGTVTMPAANAYHAQMVKTLDATLEPVSSINGQNGTFYYTSTTNVGSTGNANTEKYVLFDDSDENKAASLSAYKTNYGISTVANAVPYVDYVFALQATNSNATNIYNVNLTKCLLTFAGAADAEDAWRIAVLVQSCDNATTASTTVNTITVLGTTDSAYFDVTGGTSNTTPDAVSGIATLDDVVHYNSAAKIGSVAAGATEYFKVTVRIWLEGEDTDCTSNTFAALSDGKWTLDLDFELEDGGVDGTTAGNVKSAYSKAIVAKNAYNVAAGATNQETSNVVLSGTTYYAYTATGAATTIYGDSDTLGSVGHWYTITGNTIYEITNYVNVATA